MTKTVPSVPQTEAFADAPQAGTGHSVESVPGSILVDRDLVVELEDIGEGLDGDYDEDNSNDVALLRFYVSRIGDDGEPEALEDASYCTQLPVALDEATRQAALERIVSDVREAEASGHSLKRTFEKLSWLSPDELSSGPRP